MIRICVAGATGSVGREIVKAILSRPADYVLVSAWSRRLSGQDISEAIGVEPCGTLLTSDISEALDAAPDVLIDYTHPVTIAKHTEAALRRRISVVMGATGLFDSDFQRIDLLAKQYSVGAITGNFCLTGALQQHLGRITARYLSSWEIIDYAPANKLDVPSGTARELGELLGREREPDYELADNEFVGPVAALGARLGGTRIHSVRLPGLQSAVEIIFGKAGERITIRRDSYDRSIFVEGSLLAARHIRNNIGLIRGLDSLLFRGEPECG